MAKSIQTNIKIEGARETAAILRELPIRSVEIATRQAVSAGATPVVKATRAAAPVESGLLKKAITKKAKYFKSSATAISIIGANSDLSGEFHGRKRRPSKYWFLLIRGTAHSPANDFRAAALASSADAAADKMTSKMQEAVERQAAKLARK